MVVSLSHLMNKCKFQLQVTTPVSACHYIMNVVSVMVQLLVMAARLLDDWYFVPEQNLLITLSIY